MHPGRTSIANHVAPLRGGVPWGTVLSPVAGFQPWQPGRSEWSVVRPVSACYYGGVTPGLTGRRLVWTPIRTGRRLRIGGKDKITEWEYREDRHGC